MAASISRSVDPVRMRIGQLARISRLSPDTLRAYERRGLVRPSSRSRGRFREYGVEAIAQVERVQNALALGFTLAELSEFQRARSLKKPPCRAVRAAAEGKLRRVESELARLHELRAVLRRTLRVWDEKLAASDPRCELALLDDLSAKPAEKVTILRSAFRTRSSCA